MRQKVLERGLLVSRSAGEWWEVEEPALVIQRPQEGPGGDWLMGGQRGQAQGSAKPQWLHLQCGQKRLPASRAPRVRGDRSGL